MPTTITPIVFIISIHTSSVLVQFLLSPKALFNSTTPLGCFKCIINWYSQYCFWLLSTTHACTWKQVQLNLMCPQNTSHLKDWSNQFFFFQFVCFNILLAGHLHVNMFLFFFSLKVKKKNSTQWPQLKNLHTVSTSSLNNKWLRSLNCC